MIYYPNPSTDPHYNLALEEYLMDILPEDSKCLLLWQNRPSIIIGKHQNTIEEINADFVRENNINVVRRMSGGGAVYHDLGNLNFTFIVGERIPSQLFDFRSFTVPVVSCLRGLGVQAEFNNRNDLTIDEKKFSGNAQFIRKRKCLHHGTLLFNINLDHLEQALRVSQDKIESKGIKSVRSRVTNILPLLSVPITLEEFKHAILDELERSGDRIEIKHLTPEEEKKIQELVRTKYGTWEWNYGESPRYTLKKSRRFDFGKVEVLLDVNQGIIQTCKLYGDFFGKEEISILEEKLAGCRYEKASIEQALAGVNVSEYGNGLTLPLLFSLLTQ
ncbi:MAG: lipoate--protein ligase [Candidatus Atribacteria bacterium]|nr:lipoate--protein ligase [Candidatus Atribacteria bacterium]